MRACLPELVSWPVVWLMLTVSPTTYSLAAGLIRALRVVVIGKILLDAISLAAAIISGGASAAVSVLARTGASAAINVIIDQTINELLGGGQ